MNRGLKTLYLMELRRQWTWITVVYIVLFATVGLLLIQQQKYPIALYRITDKFYVLQFNFLIPMLSIIFGAGFVSNDIKDGWLRSLLIRPITRNQYLVTKAIATLSTIVIVALLTCVISFSVYLMVINTLPVEVEVLSLLIIALFAMLQGTLFLSILAFFSCWLRGLFNSMAFVLWGILAISSSQWLGIKSFEPIFQISREYLFPSGFRDAAGTILNGLYIPFHEVAWGVAALLFFVGLSFYSIAKVQVDAGSE